MQVLPGHALDSLSRVAAKPSVVASDGVCWCQRWRKIRSFTHLLEQMFSSCVRRQCSGIPQCLMYMQAARGGRHAVLIWIFLPHLAMIDGDHDHPSRALSSNSHKKLPCYTAASLTWYKVYILYRGLSRAPVLADMLWPRVFSRTSTKQCCFQTYFWLVKTREQAPEVPRSTLTHTEQQYIRAFGSMIVTTTLAANR